MTTALAMRSPITATGFTRDPRKACRCTRHQTGMGDAGGSGANDPNLYGTGYASPAYITTVNTQQPAASNDGFSWGNFANNVGSAIGGFFGGVARGTSAPTANPTMAPVPTSQGTAFNWGDAVGRVVDIFTGRSTTTPGTVATYPGTTPQPAASSASIVPGISNTMLFVGAGLALAFVVMSRRR